MGVIYKPFGIILGIVAGLIGKRIFTFVWTKIDDEEPAEPTTGRRRGRRSSSSARCRA